MKSLTRAHLVKALLRLCALLPLPLVHAFGGVIGRLASRLPSEIRCVSRLNIELCFPELDGRQRRNLMRRSLIETGKTITETGPLWFWKRGPVLELVRAVSGEDRLETAIANGKGVILAIPHLGNWEMVGLYCSARHPMTSLYRPPRLPGLHALITRSRERFGARLVPTGAVGVRALYRALGSGELVAILPDQEPKKGGGVFAPFFGQTAFTMTLLPRLAAKTGAAVFFTYAERLPRGRGFHLHFLPASDFSGQPVEAIAAAVNTGIESCIRQVPEQYQWGYKRFKTRPEGKTDVYKR